MAIERVQSSYFRLRSVFSCLLVFLCLQWTLSEAGYSIAGRNYEYRLLDENNRTCIYASFKMKYTVYYHNSSDPNKTMSSAVPIPPVSNVTIGGQCNESQLVLSWMGMNFSTTLQFKEDSKHWWLSRIAFSFSFNNTQFKFAEEQGRQQYVTEEKKLFNRSFGRHDYFYCKSCKMYYFTENPCNDEPCASPCVSNNSTCSYVEMRDSVLYLGDISRRKPNKKLCLEDYIRLQEIIVPAVVGGVLAILLVLIFVAYIVAYIRRKKKESNSQYEPVGEY